MLIFRFGTIAILFTAFAVFPLDRANSQPVDSSSKQQSQQVYSLLDRCQPILSQRIGGRIFIGIDTLQDYFISNAENGLTGQGSVEAAGESRQFIFDCRVNIRDGRVIGITHSFIDDSEVPNPPSDGRITAIVDTPNGQPISLRYGPGTEYFVIETVPNGGSITLNGQSNGNWAQTAGGAWVYRPYLRLVP